jgi:hypothetical protein
MPISENNATLKEVGVAEFISDVKIYTRSGIMANLAHTHTHTHSGNYPENATKRCKLVQITPSSQKSWSRSSLVTLKITL